MSERYDGSQTERKEIEFTAEYKIVRYDDGESALVFANPDEVVAWEGNKYVVDPRLEDDKPLIITTESGNQYAVGNGVVLNARDRIASRLPKDRELPNIVLGEPWSIPGVGRTSAVTEVAARYKMIPEGMGDEQLNSPSPFPGAMLDLKKADRGFIERGK